MADEVWPVIEEALRHWRKVQGWIVEAQWVIPVEKAHAQQTIVTLDRLLEEHRVLDEVLAEPTVEPEPSPFEQRARRLWTEYVERFDLDLWRGSFSTFFDELKTSPLVLVERNHAGGHYVISLHDSTENVADEINNGTSDWETWLIVDMKTGERYFPHVEVKAGGWRWP